MNPTTIHDAIIQEIVIEAPAERIFQALTDPAQRLKWWGAEGRFQTTEMQSDLRPGGQWLMRGDGIGGKPFTVRGKYQQIEPPRLLSFTWLPDWQDDAIETLVRFELTEHDGLTTVRVTHSGLTSESARLSHKGWPQILTWLREYSERQG